MTISGEAESWSLTPTPAQDRLLSHSTQSAFSTEGRVKCVTNTPGEQTRPKEVNKQAWTTTVPKPPQRGPGTPGPACSRSTLEVFRQSLPNTPASPARQGEGRLMLPTPTFSPLKSLLAGNGHDL